MKSKEVVCLGWFEWFHIELHSIEYFKIYLRETFQQIGHTLEFDVYVQQVHIGSRNKTIPHALTFVVNTEQHNLGSNLVEDLIFDKIYNRLNFHPFVSQYTLAHREV